MVGDGGRLERGDCDKLVDCGDAGVDFGVAGVFFCLPDISWRNCR